MNPPFINFLNCRNFIAFNTYDHLKIFQIPDMHFSTPFNALFALN